MKKLIMILIIGLILNPAYASPIPGLIAVMASNSNKNKHGQIYFISNTVIDQILLLFLITIIMAIVILYLTMKKDHGE